LTRLTLFNNKLSGTIPETLGFLLNLSSLNLHNNYLSGAIPLSFTNLTELNQFTFYNTYLCEPTDADFLTWKGTVWMTWSGTNQTCPFMHHIYLPLLQR
ncbi:MAG TPA: hypothetical protein VN364_10130, partial [Bellilinea sp.]|nr:hypothetical protein [Bellilinea sp.]